MWIWLVVSIAALIVLVFLWGLRRLRRSSAEAQAAIAKVTPSDIPRPRDECERVILETLSERLSLDRYEDSARILSSRLDDLSLKKIFARDDFWWYFVLPVGAYVGELLKVHAGGEWKTSASGGMEMTLPVQGGLATAYPFDKVLKQALSGDKGDLYAYFMSAVRLENVVADISSAKT
jgi:hypothetical protein